MMGIRTGTSGNDKIVGKAGVKDTFRGLAGSDNLRGNGGAGDHDVVDYSMDAAFGATHGVKVNLSAETVHSKILTDSAIDSFGFRDRVSGIADVIGTKFADIIHGGGHDNVLNGGAGNDLINGHRGNDRVIGGLGADKLYGGEDADTFVFGHLAHSTVALAGRDTIVDFSHDQGDRISLSAIDANARIKGNQAFTFIGTQGFHHKAGELHVTYSGSKTIVSGDVNGDAKADFAITLKGHLTLGSDDFVL
jgi:Ca2+-binding RTX toxin-like protein